LEEGDFFKKILELKKMNLKLIQTGDLKIETISLVAS